MKTLAAILSIVLVAGCVSHDPIVITAPTLVPRDTVYACARNQLVTLGYTIENTDLIKGTILARKLTHSFDGGIIGGNTRHAVLIVVFNADSATHKLEVIAGSDREEK